MRDAISHARQGETLVVWRLDRLKKELDVAMNREIADGDVVVLPLLCEKCEFPELLKGKLYADFTDPDTYDDVLGKLLHRLRIR